MLRLNIAPSAGRWRRSTPVGRTLTAIVGLVTLSLVVPAIPRAFTLKLGEGLPSEAKDVLGFTAQPAGEYLIFCGVPGHGASGMWIRLRVSATATTPALLLTGAVG